MGARYADRTENLPALHAALSVDPSDIAATVIVTDDAGAAAHGALRMLEDEWEVKRVVVAADRRGRGLGTLLMSALEQIAARRGAARVILQTGDRQPDAVALYRRLGYTEIPVYPPYIDTVPFSKCFAKVLTPTDAQRFTEPER